jgi:aminoglycoside phosphotransferase (APT) family kinase protein
VDRKTIDWAAEILGSPIHTVRALTGGMDSSIHILEPERGDPVVLRSSPHGVGREANVLRTLETTPVPAPALVGVDATGERCGTPSVLVELMPGGRDIPGDVRTLAAELARTMAAIHDVPAPEGPPDETAWVTKAIAEDRADLNGQVPSPAMWSLLRGQAMPTSTSAHVLIHNDFAPHNTLFVGDRLSGVVDWTWAAAGEPAADVAFCQVNVALVLGTEAGELVRQAYEAETGSRLLDQGWWDLVAAVRVEPDLHYWTRSANYFGPPELTTETVVDRFRRFVEAAKRGSERVGA